MNTAQETLALLRAPVPEELISIKEGGIRYIPWYHLVDLLSERTDGLWNFEIDLKFNDNRTIVVGKLTIHCEDFTLVRQSSGQEEHDEHNIYKGDGKRQSSYGDPTSNAEAMAFRRCCAKFGLGLDLYQKRKGKPPQNTRPSSPTKPSSTPALRPAQKAHSNLQHQQQVSLECSEIIKQWKTPSDAITWAQSQLPDWDNSYIQSSFESLPIQGKKALAWVDWVRKRKGLDSAPEEAIPY